MTIVKQTTGEYRIDLDSTIKSTYNSSTLVKIDNVTVGTALPYTGSLSIGIHDIYLELTGSTGTYKERRCFLADDDLECQVLTALAELPTDKRALDNSIYQYFLIKESQSNVGDGCACACSSLKSIYSDLKSSFEIGCC